MQPKSSMLGAALAGAVALGALASELPAADYLNTVVTDGQRDFAEGVLKGYFLQAEGDTLCANPYVIGKYVSCKPALKIAGKTYRAPNKKVWVKTNGQLGAMQVIDARGKLRCTGPVAANQFRGPDSYLSCP